MELILLILFISFIGNLRRSKVDKKTSKASDSIFKSFQKELEYGKRSRIKQKRNAAKGQKQKVKPKQSPQIAQIAPSPVVLEAVDPNEFEITDADPSTQVAGWDREFEVTETTAGVFDDLETLQPAVTSLASRQTRKSPQHYRRGMKEAIIYAEVLGKPKALRK